MAFPVLLSVVYNVAAYGRWRKHFGVCEWIWTLITNDFFVPKHGSIMSVKVLLAVWLPPFFVGSLRVPNRQQQAGSTPVSSLLRVSQIICLSQHIVSDSAVNFIKIKKSRLNMQRSRKRPGSTVKHAANRATCTHCYARTCWACSQFTLWI